MSERKPHKVAKNSLINTIAFGVNAVIGFLTVSLIVRAFGLEAQGLVAFAKLFTTAGYLALFCLGLPTVVTRKVAFYKGKQQEDICQSWVALGLRASLFLATPIALIFFAVFFVPSLHGFFNQVLGLQIMSEKMQSFFIWLVMLTIPFQFLGMICQAILFGLQEFAEIRISEIGTTVLNLFAAILFWQQGWAPEYLAMTVIFFELARSSYLSFFVLRRYPFLSLIRTDVKYLYSEFKSELKISLFGSLMAFLDNNAILYLSAQLLGPTGLGLYDSLSKISRIMKTAFGLITSALMPHAIATEAAKGEQRVVKLFNDMSYVAGVLLLPPLMCLMALSGLILHFWLGQKYVHYSPLLALGFLTTAGLVLISLQGSLFSSRREVLAQSTVVNFFENLFGLPLLYWMCLQFSVAGLFVNRLLVVWIGLVPRSLVISKHYRFKALSTLKPFRWSALFSLVMGVLIYIVDFQFNNILLSILLSAVMLIFNWVLIYRFSDTSERQLIDKIVDEVMKLARVR